MHNLIRILTLVLCVLSISNAHATHFRYSHISWRATGVAGEIVFTVSSSFRRGAPGTFAFGYNGTATDGGLAVGDIFQEYIGATRLHFGDGALTPVLIYKVDAINTVEDWVIAHAINPTNSNEWTHTYAGTGLYTAKIDSCCRTGVEHNNPGKSYEVSTIIDLGLVNSSPVSSITPIVACPKGPCIFQIPAVDVDFDSTAARLSTAVEAGDLSFKHPGTATANPLTISPSGLVTWDSTSFLTGLYSTSITLDESRLGGAPHGKVMLDFLINTDEFLGVAPHFVVPPTPASGTTFNVTGGSVNTFTVQCADGDPGDIVTIDTLRLPDGATLSPTQAIGNPATATFSWTPIQTTAQSISFTCTDTKGNRALPHSVNFVVTGFAIPPGPDRDNDLFCDNMSINQLIASGIYNVIDNFLQPSKVLLGTAGRDLILAGGLGDQMFGLGADDCIIGGTAADYASGGPGADQIFGWSGDDVLEGDTGDDFLMGRDGNDVVLGGPGNDELYGWDNEDLMYGGDGDDTFFGGDDIDRMHGEAGNDQLSAEGGEDVLVGGPGDDGFDGGFGSDVCVLDAQDTAAPVGCVVFPPVSTAPVLLTQVGDLVLDEQATLSINIVADDADPPGGPEPIPGSGLSFVAEHLPAFAILTDNGDRTATLEIVPQPGDAGSYYGVILRVDDDGEPVQSDIEVFDLLVTGGNDAPVLGAIGSQLLAEGQSVSLLLTAIDPDATDLLTYVDTGLPSFATLTDHGDRTATLDINPGMGDAGQYHGILIRVIDNGVPIKDDSEIVSIVVTGQPNQPPVISPAIGDLTVEEGQTLLVNVTATDPDGDNIAISGLSLPDFVTVTDHGNNSATLDVHPAVGDAGLHQGIVVQTTDDGQPPASDSEIFSITVSVAVIDTDTDTVVDVTDNCTLVPNPDQRDSNSDGFGNVCDADLNNDGSTNSVDLGLFANVFFTADADADINGDGNVDSLDLGLLVPMFFNPPGPAGLLP